MYINIWIWILFFFLKRATLICGKAPSIMVNVCLIRVPAVTERIEDFIELSAPVPEKRCRLVKYDVPQTVCKVNSSIFSPFHNSLSFPLNKVHGITVGNYELWIMKLAVFNVKSISIRSNKSSKQGYDQYDVSIINFIHDKASANIYFCVSFFIMAVIVCKRCNLSYNLYYNESKSVCPCVCPPLFFFEFRLCPFTHPPKDWKEAERYSWFHIKGSLRVHMFNGDYLSIPSAHR